jgi:hypothetical protein
MALSFLYRAFCSILQLIRFFRPKDADLAIEVVILGHEVTVLRRRSTAQCCSRLIGQSSPPQGDSLLAAGRIASWSSEPLCCAGNVTSSPGAGPTHTETWLTNSPRRNRGARPPSGAGEFGLGASARVRRRGALRSPRRLRGR